MKWCVCASAIVAGAITVLALMPAVPRAASARCTVTDVFYDVTAIKLDERMTAHCRRSRAPAESVVVRRVPRQFLPHAIPAAGSGPGSGAVARLPQDKRAGGLRAAALYRRVPSGVGEA
jgi:hypothetical protein